jgi:hypothetical protein
MALEILGFFLIPALSFGALYFLLGPEPAASGWRANETHVGAAVIGTVVVSATLVAMLVGLLPTVLLVVTLVAFIADRSSKEPLDLHAVSDLMRGLMGLIGLLKEKLPELLARADLDRVRRHPAFAAARRTVEPGYAKAAELLRPFVRGVAAKYKRAHAPRREARANGAQPAVSAGSSGIEAAVPVSTGIPGQPAPDAKADILRRPGPRLTRDQARRLLDELEGATPSRKATFAGVTRATPRKAI